MPKTTNENAGRDRLCRYGMRGASLLCSAVLFLGGCMVAKSKYEMAVAEMEAAKTELEKSRMWYASLKQENDKLRDDHQQAVLGLEMLSAEIHQIKDGQQSERDLLSTREAELQRDREAMTSKLRAVQLVHQQLKSRNRALRDTVRRYQKELKESRRAAVTNAASAQKNVKSKFDALETPSPGFEKSSPKPSSDPGTIPFKGTVAPEGNSPGAPPLAATKSTPKPVPPPIAVPVNGTATPVNINTASANDLELFLGLTKEVADKVVSNRPYRLRGELISKQVVPKATFDVIKDRITAAPQ